ncbi:hypothetical protein N7466_005844 [Penicillium verhagenii]|uniref:uncharacterized protein n=1 Tax=Penicillium verhagenii TaxID=1562060 RepID=UPI00254581F6|nr:uncharacterized protein N7466_005844 [Penicillium verhagenii]KAJ5930351.1 hypothetical protein N7466_005844 [Penicillium verhagenii]
MSTTSTIGLIFQGSCPVADLAALMFRRLFLPPRQPRPHRRLLCLFALRRTLALPLLIRDQFTLTLPILTRIGPIFPDQCHTAARAQLPRLWPSQPLQFLLRPLFPQQSVSQASGLTSSSPAPTTDVPSGSVPTQPTGSLPDSTITGGSPGAQSTTSTILSTRTATITACPSSIPNCPASSKTTFVTTETIVVSTTVCPVTETAGAQATSTSLPAGQGASESENPGFTTSTVFTTRVATITACPASVTDCPARSKTTFLTTETIVDSTTVCPLTEVTQATSTAIPEGQASSTSETPGFTTSTIVSTRVVTITACPASVTNCPARMKTTSLTTETIVVSTTVCPVTEAAGATQTGYPSGTSAQTAGGNDNGNEGSESTISTVWSTRIATVTACPLSVTNCPLRSKTTYLTTETLAVGTTAVAVSAENTSVPSEGATVTTSVINVNPQAASTATVSSPAVTAGAESGSSGSTGGQGSGSGVEAVYTALYTMESCANGDTCTEYVSTVVTTQTNVAVAQPTMTSASYKPASGSGAQGHPAASASSAHAWPQGSQAAGASSASASSTSSAPYAVYTGGASSISQLSVLQISATLMVMLAAILA